ncbi:MAG: nitroreductase family protein [Clostridium sp.]|jgi:nitroreductase|nr:nitroreductase family protein [Clostridium sp.]
MNETLRAIFERSSCRDFDGTTPAREQLELIAKAALASPSAMNVQPWHICVIADGGLLSELDKRGLEAMAALAPSSYERIMGRGGRLFYGAGALAVVWVKDSYQPGAELLDCGIVVQSMALAAQSIGLGSCICGLAQYCFAGTDGEGLAQDCGRPEGYRFGMGVLLGRAKSAAAPHEPDGGKLSFR